MVFPSSVANAIFMLMTGLFVLKDGQVLHCQSKGKNARRKDADGDWRLPGWMEST